MINMNQLFWSILGHHVLGVSSAWDNNHWIWTIITLVTEIEARFTVCIIMFVSQMVIAMWIHGVKSLEGLLKRCYSPWRMGPAPTVQVRLAYNYGNIPKALALVDLLTLCIALISDLNMSCDRPFCKLQSLVFANRPKCKKRRGL